MVTAGTARTIDVCRKERAYINKLIRSLAIADIYSPELVETPVQAARNMSWRMLQEAASRHKAARDYHAAAMAYLAMCWLKDLHSEDPTAEIVERNRLDLLQLKGEGFRTVRITGNPKCHVCSRIVGRTQPIEEALSNPILPGNCTVPHKILSFYHGVLDDWVFSGG
ncbi:MAG: hypothetical protein WBG50_17180 [Desulfomonilaceae bacterium]